MVDRGDFVWNVWLCGCGKGSWYPYWKCEEEDEEEDEDDGKDEEVKGNM